MNSRDGGDSRWRDDLDIVHQSHRVASEHLDNIKVKISINIKSNIKINFSIKTNIHIESSPHWSRSTPPRDRGQPQPGISGESG